MAFSDFETHRYTKIVKEYVESHRPPPEIRKELDLGYLLEDQSFVIYETRPRYKKPDETLESPVFKTTFVRTSDDWKILWMRSDLKWHTYDPDPVIDSLEEALEVLEADELACFFG